MKKFDITSEFKGYRAREDKTNLPPGYLVAGSQDVLTNSANRIGSRKGYTLDGQANATLNPIEASYDWNMHIGQERNVRSWDDELEFRFVDSGGTVTWNKLADGFTSVAFNFAEFWDNAELIDVLLFVNGTSNIFEWSGGVTTFASATANTITKQGTTTWGEESFYTAGTRNVIIGGIVYNYTGGEGTTTITGVTPDPTLGGHNPGDIVHQEIRTTANAAIAGLPNAFANDLISTLYNQVYIGSLTSREVYVSKANNYTDFTFATPRAVGEGALFTLDGVAVGFAPQEDQMYISAGKGQWYQTKFELSTTQLLESLTVTRLKTDPDSAAISQAYIGKSENKVAYLSNEPAFNLFGRVDNIFALPDMQNISDVIRDDMNSYDFSGNGSTIFFKNFQYTSVPVDGKVLIYNFDKKWWEAPQTLPIGRFSVIGGELYGHSSAVPETYKLYDGYNDNGASILSQAIFSYQHFGTRANLKNFNEMYVEGYIAGNTLLDMGIKYEIDGCATETFFEIDGSDTQIVCIPSDDNSLGKHPLGSYPLGSLFFGPNAQTLPPKFRVKKTFARKDFFEVQFAFSSFGKDQNWELICFGPQVKLSENDSPFIKQ